MDGFGFDDDDDDDDNENAVSLDKIKNELSINFDDNDKSSKGNIFLFLKFSWILSCFELREYVCAILPPGPDDDAHSVVSGSTRVGMKVNAQPVFQPSSTPESLQHRFMVF